jgi:hypothetical protein
MADLIPGPRTTGTVEVAENRTIISVVGEGLRNTRASPLSVFSDQRHQLSMISVGASSVN